MHDNVISLNTEIERLEKANVALAVEGHALKAEVARLTSILGERLRYHTLAESESAARDEVARLREALHNISWNYSHLGPLQSSERPDGWSGCGKDFCGPCGAYKALQPEET